jgi:hypothetical protein
MTVWPRPPKNLRAGAASCNKGGMTTVPQLLAGLWRRSF